MKELFVPLSECIQLKQMGCNLDTLGCYIQGRLHIQEWNNSIAYEWCKTHDEYPAYLYQQIFQWFRDKYGIDVEITRCIFVAHSYYYHILIANDRSNTIKQTMKSNRSYLECELDCLQKLIEIINKKNEIFRKY